MFGSGALASGCNECARAWEEADRVPFGSYWPRPHNELVEMVLEAESGPGG
jgi:hypothetical protein